MTQEQKAKAYDEALLRADEAVQKGCLDKDMFDIIFPPEESEDERIRKRLLWFLANYTGRWDYPETRMACRAWLEKQKEQKPAWSEEDEKMRLEAIRVFVSGCERYRKESGCLPGWHKVINWLKDLRSCPSWKPSEEQMEALQRAIDACESEWAYKDDELRSLLSDLKKL